jgi:hypothetical protein
VLSDTALPIIDAGLLIAIQLRCATPANRGVVLSRTLTAVAERGQGPASPVSPGIWSRSVSSQTVDPSRLSTLNW